MKKLFMLLVVAISLTSCGRGYKMYETVASNGSIIVARDNMNRDYSVGDTVCIRYTSGTMNWIIDGDGIMTDTSFVFQYFDGDSDTSKSYARRIYQKAVIKQLMD